MDQHELMIRVLIAAGGAPVEKLVVPGYTGKIADILFERDDVIVEVKSITTDRAASDDVAGAVGEMFVTHAHLGAPIIFGSVNISPQNLPRPIAANLMRIVGKRVLAEAKNANAQIKATKTMLGRPQAVGVLALITPPFKLDRRSIVWCMGDAMREGRNSGVDELFLVETHFMRLASFIGMGTASCRAIPGRKAAKPCLSGWRRRSVELGVRSPGSLAGKPEKKTFTGSARHLESA